MSGERVDAKAREAAAAVVDSGRYLDADSDEIASDAIDAYMAALVEHVPEPVLREACEAVDRENVRGVGIVTLSAIGQVQVAVTAALLSLARSDKGVPDA